MVKLFVRHQVKDLDAWHDFYRRSAGLRAQFGVLADEVFRGVEDRTDVTITHDFTSVTEIGNILGSPDMQAALTEAGVIGAPTAWVVESVS